MKYKITIVVEGTDEFKNDLEKGYVENGIKEDIFPDENILSFNYEMVRD